MSKYGALPSWLLIWLLHPYFPTTHKWTKMPTLAAHHASQDWMDRIIDVWLATLPLQAIFITYALLHHG